MPRPRSHTPGFCLDSFHQLAYVPLNGRRKHLGAYPVEKYRRRVEKLKTDFATGKITAEQLVHSTRRAKRDCATGENRDAYRRAVKDFREAEPKVDPRDAGQRINVNALVNAWLQHACEERGLSWQPTDGRPPRQTAGELANFWDILRPLCRTYGQTEAAKFGKEDLRKLANVLATEPRRRGDRELPPMSRKVIARHLHRIKTIWSWAADEGKLLRSNELKDFKVHRAVRNARASDPVKPVGDEHLDAVLHFLTPTVRAMVRVQRLTGMRPLVAMRWCDIDRNRQDGGWIYRPATHKTAYAGKSRPIVIFPDDGPIFAGAQGLLQSVPVRVGVLPIFSPAQAAEEARAARSEKRKTPINQGNRAGTKRVNRQPKRKPGDRYTVAAYAAAIRRACDVADRWAKGGFVVRDDERLIPRFHPHQLRHAFATESNIKNGQEITRILLGHSLRTTTDLYVEPDLDAALRLVKRA